MSPRRLGLLTLLLAGILLAFSALTHAASGRGRAAALSSLGGLAVAGAAAAGLNRAGGAS